MKHSVLGWVVSAGLLAGCGLGCDAGALAQAIASPAAGATTLVEPPTPLLPTNDRLVANDNAAAVPAGKPELAQVLVEDGLKRTETRAVMNGSAAAGWVRAYQFVDATGAFSAYTYFREGGRPVRNTPAGVSEVELPGGEMVLLSGVTVVRVDWKLRGDASNTALAAIVQGLPKVGGRRGLAPLLPTLFPKPGLEADSLRYALGPATYRAEGGILPADILGWDKSAEVGTATYTGRGGKGTLTLLLYPTPEIAGNRGRAIEQAVNEQIRQQGPESLGTVKLKRLGPLVEMTSGSWTPEQALALLASVHLNQEITFDKPVPPEFHAEIRKTYTLLQSIALFVGLGILAALVLGIFLGGLRAGIRVLQGKPAASEPEFLTIDLRGRPAPLQPSHPPQAEIERR
jgi:hypothetical protein